MNQKPRNHRSKPDETGPSAPSPATTQRLAHWLRRLVTLEPTEGTGVAWAFIYHFCLLCSYYVLRPIRDEMGIAGGVEQLQWLFLATFIAMLAIVPLFGWLTSRIPRKRFLPYAYLFFASNLLAFYVLFQTGVARATLARVFFVWVSVYNLFVISVFWSFMSDLFRPDQSKRLFGFIAAGGSVGALVGPALAAGLAPAIGVAHLLLVSAALLLTVLLCIGGLTRWHARTAQNVNPEQSPPHLHSVPRATPPRDERKLGGGMWAGVRLVLRSPYLLGICLLILLYTTLSTFLYFQQAHIVERSFASPALRTRVFAGMDLATNALTLTFQTLLTARLIRRVGVPVSLALVPVLLMTGFGALALAPTLTVLILVQVLRRAGNYAIMKPVREMLYVVVTREEKYKAKNFIDTAIYRSGDALSAWLFTGLRGLGLTLSQIAWVAVPLTGVWAWVAFRLGKHHDQKVAAGEVEEGGHHS